MKNRIQVRKKPPLTLLEIMIVIFLIGLNSSVIGFNMKGSLDKAKVFKTEKGISRIKEILPLEIAKNELSIEDISSGDAEVNRANAKECLRRSGMVKNARDTFKDGWGEEYEIIPGSDSLEDFEIVSRKLYAYKEKNSQSREETVATPSPSRQNSFTYSPANSQSNENWENRKIQRNESRYVSLPSFRYHPDPLSTGSIISSEESCECCDEARGYVINAPIYCVEEVESLCPWCVADGSASEKFDGLFVDDQNLKWHKIPESIIEEVTKRTPGFNGLQQERWLSHCLDACQFHGRASIEEIKQLSREEVLQAVDDGRFYSYCRDDNYWNELFNVYQADRSISFYKFSCLHCKKLLYYMDAF